MPRLSRRPFLDFLCDEHVIVTPDWETMNPSVTHILYDHGLRCPPHGRKLHKGESDASYNQFSKKARIGIIIWRDDQVVLSEVMEELDCNGSSVQAEALAMYLLLKRAIQQGIRSLEVCTECEVVDRVICGEQRPGDKDTLGELYNLLRWMISHLSIILLFGQQMKPPRSLSRPINSHVNRRKKEKLKLPITTIT